MTSQATLFEENDQITPSEAYTEPQVWIRRLVVIDKLAFEATVLRRVRFRCGINIITTEPRRPEDTKPIGHSVGKSLLIRLIRYCLGDGQYCTERVRRKIGVKLENAYVLATFRVAGADWVVARPLGLEFGSRYAWCAQSRHLASLLSTDKRRPYSEFLAAVNAATSACYEALELPQAERRAEWKDLLGWICRDQDCHFSHHAEWRYMEAESGPRVLSKEDAYLVMRMAMDLLGPKETGLITEHRKRLRRSAEAQYEVEHIQPQVEYAEAQWRRLIPDLANSALATSTADALEELAKDKQRSLRILLEQETSTFRAVVDAKQQAANARAKESGALEQELAQLQKDRAAQQLILEGLQKDATHQAMQSLGTGGFSCSFFETKVEAFAAECPGKKIQQLPLASPERTVWIDACKARIKAVDSKMEDCAARTKDADAKAKDAQEKLTSAQDALQKLSDDLPGKIGAWSDRESQAQALKVARAGLIKKQNELPKLATRVKDSQESLMDCRDKLGGVLNQLSHYYTILLRWTITPDADGKVTLDGNGLHPEPGAGVADSGTTLREYADVLSFDLACLAAAVCGLGHLPRLWIHDSPRQADSEEQLFHAILRFLQDLEAKYKPGRTPSFQYIMTTTSPPPDVVNTSPYVRLRLHAREAKGKLLRCDFGK